MCMETAASPHSSTDDTSGSEPQHLNFLKQSLLGYGDFNVACQAGGALPSSWGGEGHLGYEQHRVDGGDLVKHSSIL